MSAATLHLGPAADVLRDRIAPRSVALAYADPPFGNDQVWRGEAGVFSDRWRPSADSEAGWAALRAHSPVGCTLVECSVAGRGATAAPYIGVMAGILLGVRRVLDRTGSLWLHHDDTMGAHLRILGDVVFGPANALGSVIWRRSRGKTTKRRLGRCHDTISVWGRGRAARRRLQQIASPFTLGDLAGDPFRVDGIATDELGATARERVGYPTQKPLALLERIVRVASLPGDLVLDPTCGSGTTLVAATGLGRRAIGIDISPDAIAAAEKRLGVVEPVRQTRPLPPQAELFGVAA